MNTISKQIIEILSKNDIDEKDYLNSLSNIYEDIKFSLWKEITIAPNILSFIRSLCFYNFEHKVNCPEHGNCNIQYYGSKYNVLMFEIQDGYISKDKVKDFINELEDILKNIKNDKDLKAANLYADFDFDWRIDDKNSTRMIVFDSNENPQKYGYHASGRNYTGIYGKDGKQIVIDQNIVLCSIEDIDKNRELPLVKSTITNLLSKSKEALDSNKGIFINMNNYNYEF